MRVWYIFLLIFVVVFGRVVFATESIVIYAASSLTGVLPKVVAAWKKSADPKVSSSLTVEFNFDATSRLATQIEAGAPADIFFSADMEWMRYLEKKGRIISGTRSTFLENDIVVIVPVRSTFVPQSAAELVDKRIGNLAVAGESVPAGRYARAALHNEGILSALSERLVSAGSVRAALRWVAMGEAQAGIVFVTDVADVSSRDSVKVAFRFRPQAYPRVQYPAAVLARTKLPERARSFIEFCKGAQAKELFISSGFKWAID